MGIYRSRAALLAGLAAAAAFFLIVITRPLGNPEAYPGFQPAEQALKDDAARSGRQTGTRAPGLDGMDLRLTSLAGSALDLAGYRGQPLWIVFWATTCHACQLEEADLIARYRAHQADGLALLAIDYSESADVVASYAKAHGLPYPIAIDSSGAAADAYGAIGTPTHFFVDSAGVIRERAFGRLVADEMERLIGPILRS